MDATYGVTLVPRWVAGAHEPTFWTGTKVRGKELRNLETYRCPKCGYLKSYANEIAIDAFRGPGR